MSLAGNIELPNFTSQPPISKLIPNISTTIGGGSSINYIYYIKYISKSSYFQFIINYNNSFFTYNTKYYYFTIFIIL